MSNSAYCIIQCRQGSTRLPGKALLEINGKTILHRVIQQVKAVNCLEKGLIKDIVVATSTNIKDNPIQLWCMENSIEYFRGSEEDVLDRYYQCAKKYGMDWILRITADCPVVEPVAIYSLLKELPRRSYRALDTINYSFPVGWDAELFSFLELQKAWKKAGPDEREHVTTYMRHNFRADMKSEMRMSGIKLDLDTPKDLEYIRRYITCRES